MVKAQKIVAFLAITAGHAYSQNANKPDWPRMVLLPMRTVNVSADEMSRVREERKDWQNTLRNFWLGDQRTLAEWTQPKSLNYQKKSRSIFVSTNYPQNRAFPYTQSLTIIPTWCRMLDKEVLFLQAADSQTGRLWGSVHSSFHDRDTDQRFLEKVQDLQKDMTPQFMRNLSNRLMQQLMTRRNNTKEDALHFSMRARRQSDWKRTLSPKCLNMLLEERLSQEFLTVLTHSTENLQHLRQVLGMVEGLRRPTRNVSVVWEDFEQDPKLNRWKLQARLTHSERVFGQPYPSENKAPTLTLGYDENTQTYNLEIPETLTSHLQDEKNDLLLTDRPEVVWIYGAWVYLDKGRAWGLKMRDRLVETSEPDKIQGHVVRYFGPEMGLRNSKGRLIKEGAIVYVRKGQGLTKNGQTFWFDPKTFPAAWR